MTGSCQRRWARRARLLCAVLLTAAGAAAESDSLVDRITACRSISEDAARLACFDGVELPAAPRAGVAPSSGSAGADQAAQSRFGDGFLRREPAAREAEPEAITASLERVDQRPRGEYVFYLSNGQVWVELEAGRARYRSGMEVVVERTPFGGYMLATAAGRSTRVRRIE